MTETKDYSKYCSDAIKDVQKMENDYFECLKKVENSIDLNTEMINYKNKKCRDLYTIRAMGGMRMVRRYCWLFDLDEI